MTTDEDERAELRCAVIRLDVKQGTGTRDAMVIDTTRAQSRGSGTVAFPSEALAIRITGAPTAKSVHRLPGAIPAAGTIREPQIEPQPGTKTPGTVLNTTGRSITAEQPPPATDTDTTAHTQRPPTPD